MCDCRAGANHKNMARMGAMFLRLTSQTSRHKQTKNSIYGSIISYCALNSGHECRRQGIEIPGVSIDGKASIFVARISMASMDIRNTNIDRKHPSS